MRGATFAALATTVLLAAAGCSGGAAAPSTGSSSASVTQEAPSVWSSPESGAQAAGSAAPSADSAASVAPALPGLSEDCTAAIRAQMAVNGLFGAALGSTAKAAAPLNAAAAVTSEPSAPPALTGSQVAETFGAIDATIPGPLRTAFGTLKKAADSMTSKTARDVPDILDQPQVVTAMTAIGDYITACQPATTD